MNDYYETLGIPKDSSKDEVKKAFRKMAAKYHPDKKTGDEDKYKKVTEAYSVLGNEKKKAEYDTYGHSFNGAGGEAAGAGGFNRGDFHGQAQNGQGFEFDINDIFQNFGFGGGGQQAQRGRDISIDINLTFKESIFGVTRKVLITKNNTCSTCNGSGAKKDTKMTTCSTCNGQGKIRETRQSIMGNFSTVRECSACSGRGEKPKEHCEHCSGAGIARTEEEITIKVPAGIQNGEVIRMTGRGEAVQQGQPGDFYIRVHTEEHKTIKREGSTLTTKLPIKLTDALLGATYSIETLDGNVDIKIPSGISHGELIRIKNKGVSTGHGRGDFMVKISIETPKKLSKKARNLIDELRTEGI